MVKLASSVSQLDVYGRAIYRKPSLKSLSIFVGRVRPISEKERSHGERLLLEFPGKGQVICHNTTPSQKAKVFSYNVVFEPEATQVTEYNKFYKVQLSWLHVFSTTTKGH